MEVFEVNHALAACQMTKLRDKKTNREEFQSAARTLSSFVIYEALRHLPTKEVKVQTPMASSEGVELDMSPLVVPVLRAGLGMFDAAMDLLPHSEIGFIGARRNENTLAPEIYATMLPSDIEGHPAILLDPMLATGGSLVRAAELLKERGVTLLHIASLLAAPEGISKVGESGLITSVTVGAQDEKLDENGFIVPGLGDAGDRLFGVS